MIKSEFVVFLPLFIKPAATITLFCIDEFIYQIYFLETFILQPRPFDKYLS